MADDDITEIVKVKEPTNTTDESVHCDTERSPKRTKRSSENVAVKKEPSDEVIEISEDKIKITVKGPKDKHIIDVKKDATISEPSNKETNAIISDNGHVSGDAWEAAEALSQQLRKYRNESRLAFSSSDKHFARVTRNQIKSCRDRLADNPLFNVDFTLPELSYQVYAYQMRRLLMDVTTHNFMPSDHDLRTLGLDGVDISTS
ncbi:hypothetical protein TNCV_4911181 [Trichonephila clavipes]|nr:hypothetical protein TNCV_4911181 [Trichonephila clavipes]